MGKKIAVLSLLLLIGSVACQDPPASSPMPSNYMKSVGPIPSPTISPPPSYPPSSNPSSSSAPSPMPSNIMESSNPPSSNAPAYPPPGPSPSSSVAPPVYPVASSPSLLSSFPGPSPSSSFSSPSPSSSLPSPSPSSSFPSPSPSSSFPSPSPSSSVSSPSPAPSSGGLSVGYYGYSCPNAESIVRAAVKTAIDSNPGIGAGLIRLFFHDCFVQGCDASVLLNTTASTDPTERQSPPNLTLRGFEVIDAAKAALEAACPRTVSCADVVAFASRDATFFLSGNRVDFRMPAGRLDGRVSRSDEAIANLPPPTAGVQLLKDKFAAKGLDTDDMVTLSGAHTVGRAHCSSFSDRIPPNNASGEAMNPTLASSVSQQCNTSGSGGGDPAVVEDLVTPNKLDSQYYWNVLNHDVLLASDAALLASNETATMVSDNAFKPGLWETKFKRAMVKMGLVGIKTNADGEIRDKCWMINS